MGHGFGRRRRYIAAPFIKITSYRELRENKHVESPHTALACSTRAGAGAASDPRTRFARAKLRTAGSRWSDSQAGGLLFQSDPCSGLHLQSLPHRANV